MAKHMEAVLREVFAGLSNFMRWEGLDKPQRETVAEHVFKQNVITLMLIRLEEHHGNPHNIDRFEILACSVMHDIGESVAGDTPTTIKTEEDDDREAAAFDQIIDELVPDEIKYLFPQPLDRSALPEDINRQFWDACEQVGYLVYSSFQQRLEPRHRTECIDKHLSKLRKSKFPSVRMMLDHIGLDTD